MFEDLLDPDPPEPTTGARDRVTARARQLRRRRQALVVTGGAAAFLLVVVAGFALLQPGGDDPVTTEVAGIQEANTSTTTTVAPTTVPAPTSTGMAPVVEPPPAAVEEPPPPPATSSLTAEVIVPAGFTLTGCTANGAPVDASSGSFTLVDLAPGSVVEVVCDAQSGDGAARAARGAVTLQPGANLIQVSL